jgi:hypothetical protein
MTLSRCQLADPRHRLIIVIAPSRANRHWGGRGIKKPWPLGRRTGSGLRTQNCEIKYKKPIDGGGGLNLQGLWGCHRPWAPRAFPRNSENFFVV